MHLIGVIAAALLAGSQPAPATHWAVTQVSEESAFAVDRGSIQAEGRMRLFDAAVVRMAPQPFEGERTFDYQIVRFGIDCEARTVQRLAEAFHAQGEPEPLAARELDLEPDDIAPDRSFAKAWALVCAEPEGLIWHVRATAEDLVDLVRGAPSLID